MISSDNYRKRLFNILFDIALGVFLFAIALIIFLPSEGQAVGGVKNSTSASLIAMQGTSADVTILKTAPATIASGARITYSLTVGNRGAVAAQEVFVTDFMPAGTTFASLTTSKGGTTAPAVGANGNVTYRIGAVSPDETVTLGLTLNVLAAPGTTIMNIARVFTSSSDRRSSNNISQADTVVEGGGTVELSWQQALSTPGNPTPAPANLQLDVASSAAAIDAPATAAEDAPAVLIAPGDPCTGAGTPCALLGTNVYLSNSLPVNTSPANVWKIIPPGTTQANMPTIPAGSFYVVRSVWCCSGIVTESGNSNEVAVPPGPTIKSVKAGSSIKIKGSGFLAGARVFIDGVEFSLAPSSIGNKKVKQKGTLTNGRSIAEATPTGQPALITVLNGNLGIGSYSYTRQ